MHNTETRDAGQDSEGSEKAPDAGETADSDMDGDGGGD